MKLVFDACRLNRWAHVLQLVHANPWIAITPISMDNHIVTTVLHQAITSKGDTQARAKVVLQILKVTPQAAGIRNGYGSLPLHVISQRNTKIDSRTKETLIVALIHAYNDALLEQGGVGKRTPLHVIFTGTYLREEIPPTLFPLNFSFSHDLKPPSFYNRLRLSELDEVNDRHETASTFDEGPERLAADSCCMQSSLLAREAAHVVGRLSGQLVRKDQSRPYTPFTRRVDRDEDSSQ